MSWAEKLARERRARLAAERLLEQKSRELFAANQQLAIHARHLSDEIAAQRHVVASARAQADALKGQNSRVLDDLERAHTTAVMAERRLWDSIETIQDGFAVFDHAKRLVGANHAFAGVFSGTETLAPGTAYADILRLCADGGLVALEEEGVAEWVARMLARWDVPEIAPEVIRLRGDRWIKLIDRRARDGDMVSLALDITDTIEHEAELREARARAEAASEAKSAFLANMSHELRTPMNGVVGMAELLCDSALSDEQKLYAETIRTSGEALLRIINDVLDYSRIEAARVSLRPEVFDLEHCIQDVALLLQPSAREKGLELAIDYDLFLPTRFLADPGRMRQILTNLVGNAVKFTPQGHVLVRVAGIEGEPAAPGEVPSCALVITVEDTGIGIPQDLQDHIFGEFNQVEAQTNRAFEGTGLGLAITRQLVALMEGEIWVESNPGEGACFGIRLHLPLAEPLDPAGPVPIRLKRALLVDDRLVERAILENQLRALGIAVTACRKPAEALAALSRRDAGDPAFDLVLADDPEDAACLPAFLAALGEAGWAGPVVALTRRANELAKAAGGAAPTAALSKPILRRDLLRALARLSLPAEPADAPGPAAPEPAAPPGPPRQMRVLSAEDNRTNQLVFAKMVKDLDIDLAFANDGHEAVAMAQDFAPDMIFMDISMPGMDGREATRAIRAREGETGAARVPIVALTAHAMDGDAEDILAAGLEHYLTKPLRRAAIHERILAHVPQGVRAPAPPTDAPPQGGSPPAFGPASGKAASAAPATSPAPLFADVSAAATQSGKPAGQTTQHDSAGAGAAAQPGPADARPARRAAAAE